MQYSPAQDSFHTFSLGAFPSAHFFCLKDKT